MVVVRIMMNALPGKKLELMQTLLSMIEPTRKEAGCLGYAILCDIQDQNRFSLLEEWKTREDLDYHFMTNRFNVLLGTKTLLSEPLKIQIYTVLDAEGMESVHSMRKKMKLTCPMGMGKGD
jgi:quinol monooxygenase YgiN